MKDVMSNIPLGLSDVWAPDPEAVGANLQPLDGVRLGLQSRVELMDLPGIPEGLVLLKRMGVDKGLTRDEASALQERLAPYREDLCVNGWNVPDLYATRLAATGKEWQIWSYEQYVPGQDMARLLESDGSQALARYAVRHVVDTLAGYNPSSLQSLTVDGQKLTLLPHGIDLQPANVVIADQGQVCTIDIFAPKEVDEYGNFVTYNPKLDEVSPYTLKIACATREGAILRFLRKTQKLWATNGLSADDFIEDSDEMLAMSELSADEAKFIIADMDAGYPLLDAAYKSPAN
jgi:hypothetical protein